MLITIIFLSLIGLGLILMFLKRWKIQTEVHANYSTDENTESTKKVPVSRLDEWMETLRYIYPDTEDISDDSKRLINNLYKTLNTLYPYKVKKVRKEAKESFTPENGWSKPLSEINTRAYVIEQLRHQNVPANITENKSICLNYSWDDTYNFLIGAILGILGLIGSFICGIIVMAGRAPINVTNAEIEINEKIDTLKKNKEELLHYTDSGTYTSANILEAKRNYNNDVKDFVIDVKQTKYGLDNIWISWFYNPAYSTIDITEVESLYI